MDLVSIHPAKIGSDQVNIAIKCVQGASFLRDVENVIIFLGIVYSY